MGHFVRSLGPVLVASSIVLSAAACSSPPPSPPAQAASEPAPQAQPASESVAATTSAVTAPALSAGPILTPASGSPLRKAILDAARRRLRTTRQFIVVQLFVQGEAALADLLPDGGGPAERRFFGFRLIDGAWQVVFEARHDADIDDVVLGRAPLAASPALIAKLRLSAPLPDDTATLRSSAAAAGLEAARGASTPDIGKLSVARVNLAQDRRGIWWAGVIVRPSRKDVDSLPVFLKLAGASWQVVDIGTGVEPRSDPRFPAEVRDKL